MVSSTWPARAVISLSHTLLLPRNHIPRHTCHSIRREWLGFYKKLFQAKNGIAFSGQPDLQTLCLGESWKWNWDPTSICNSTSVQREERQGHSDHSPGRQKLVNTNSWTCHAEKQFQKRNGKAAPWEKSSVGGGACFCDAEGQKGFLHLQRKPARKQKSTGMSIFAMRMKSERKARNRKKVQLIERKRLKRGIEGGEDRLVRNWKFSTALT